MSDIGYQGTNAKCPICGKPAVAEFRPFCSARCKRVDLNRWFTESYRVPEKPGADAAEGVPDASKEEE